MRLAILLDHLGNESLPLMDAAAALRAEGHVLDAFVQSAEHRFWNAARALRPDAVLVPADAEARAWARATVAEAKRFLSVPAIVCGSEPTAHPERIADLGADYAVLGEVDRPLCALAAALGAGGPAEGIPGVWTPKGGAPAAPGAAVQDLDAAPFPYRGVYQKYPANLLLGVQRFGATRGAASAGDSRAKSPERIVEEFRLVAKRTPMRAVRFEDEAFAEDRAWLAGFAEAYARSVRLPFTCGGPAASLDKERLEMLAEAGCAGFVLRIRPDESANALTDASERIHRAGWMLAVEATAAARAEAEACARTARLLGAAHARLRVDPRSEDPALALLAPWFAALARPTGLGDAAALGLRAAPRALRPLASGAGALSERRFGRIGLRAAWRLARAGGLLRRRTKDTAGYLP